MATKLPLVSPVNTSARGRGQHTGARATGARPHMPPHGFSRVIVDGLESVAGVADDREALAPQAHGAARIGVRQVQDVEAGVLVGIEKSRIRIEGGRLVVGHAAFKR